MKKTNAVRYLENLKIPFELRQYEVDEKDLGAENAALKIGVPLEQVFKTLVTRGDKSGIILACISSAGELNVKALASSSGNKKVELVPMKEIQSLTGYIRGGVSPIGTKKPYPIYLDESALQYEFISISAGVRGCQILVDPRRLIEAIHPHVVPNIRDK